MTTTLTRNATDTARAFFDAYAAHDAEIMTALCSQNADFRYEPYELWGMQRVLRGSGKVRTVGKPLWNGEFVAFPDLDITVVSLAESEDGTVVAEVQRSGTQAGAWLTLRPSGATFDSRALFVLHVTDGLIDDLAAYWDQGRVFRQLGHNEID